VVRCKRGLSARKAPFELVTANGTAAPARAYNRYKPRKPRGKYAAMRNEGEHERRYTTHVTTVA
jgi:hypothetical protein